jgi:hypothetical protein
MKFLGVDYAHLPRYAPVLLPSGAAHPMDLKVEVGSGMMCVIPAWRLRKFLDDPRVVAPLLEMDDQVAKIRQIAPIHD